MRILLAKPHHGYLPLQRLLLLSYPAGYAFKTQLADNFYDHQNAQTIKLANQNLSTAD